MKNPSAYLLVATLALISLIACTNRPTPTPTPTPTNPLVDIWWREEAQFACGTQQQVAPEHPIGELRFRADGSFDVTWVPFETYRDYWGTYTYDPQRGTLSLTIARGNYVPADVDGNGLFSIDEQGRLILTDMWLGSRRDSKIPANCGHRFTRSP
jgi:hypothetical protein